MIEVKGKSLRNEVWPKKNKRKRGKENGDREAKKSKII
jgi:hypothetical protein